MTFEEIVVKSQQALKQSLISELRKMGYRTVTKKGFIYAKGTTPILLVAHLDTVHREQVKTICYSHGKKIIMSPEGIGGDDRAGVYMILQIIKERRCHILFCEDEEDGGIGAHAFIRSDITPEVNYIVEMDRRGSNDAVFYDCENPDFTDFVCSFGFVEDYGSFSDISVVAPHLGIAAVNISAGYYSEHSQHEYVDMDAVRNNIKRVGGMVSTKSDSFEYIDAKPYYNFRRFPATTKAIQQLKEDARTFGISADDIELLLDYGYELDQVEMMLNEPQQLQRGIKELLHELMEV
jgi:hypothetical protein